MHVASGDLWAGAEAQVHTLCVALQKRDDVECAAVLLNEGELAQRLRNDGVEVRVLPERQFSMWQLVHALRAAFADWQPDVIHTHRQKENVLAGFSNRFGRRVASVRTVHGAAEFSFSPWQIRQRVQRMVDDFVGRHWQQAVIAVTDTLALELRQRFGERVHTVYNGLAVDAVAAASTASSAIPNSLMQAARHIGFVGRLVPVKRIDLLLDAVALLKAEGLLKREEHVHFHIVGDGPLRLDLERKAGELGVAPQMHFHGHRADVAALMRRFDALVFCSDHEGLPMTLLEAIALRLPVIAHRIGGLREVLVGDTGLLVDEHTPRGYANALAQLLSMGADERADMTGRAFARLERDYSASGNAMRCVDVYRRLIETPNHRAR